MRICQTLHTQKCIRIRSLCSRTRTAPSFSAPVTHPSSGSPHCSPRRPARTERQSAGRQKAAGSCAPIAGRGAGEALRTLRTGEGLARASGEASVSEQRRGEREYAATGAARTSGAPAARAARGSPRARRAAGRAAAWPPAAERGRAAPPRAPPSCRREGGRVRLQPRRRRAGSEVYSTTVGEAAEGRRECQDGGGGRTAC